MKEIRNIREALLHGFKVKAFELWTQEGGYWVLSGSYYAPARVADKYLFSYVGE